MHCLFKDAVDDESRQEKMDGKEQQADNHTVCPVGHQLSSLFPGLIINCLK